MMYKTTGTFVALSLAISATACGGSTSSPESAESVEEGPMEEAGEWTDDAADDTADAFEDAADETGEAFEEAGDEMEDETDGNPATD